MLKVQPIRCFILQDPQLFEYLQKSINTKPLEPPVPVKDPPRYTVEQQQINSLIEKYVTQAYVVGRNIDSRLKSVIKTLLGLQRNIDTSKISQSPFNSAAELVISKFPFDKTIDLLNRSTSQFLRNQDTMKEWIIYLHNSLAGLLYDSATGFIEAVVRNI